MAERKEPMSESAADRELISTRVFNVSRDRLFTAWATPDQIKTWWGPNGFTNTFHEFDFRPGGMWRFIMHGPDGTDYPNESQFVEIVRPERIVFNHISQPKFEITATFTEIEGKTKLSFRMFFESAEVCAVYKKIAVSKNEENFDRLEAVLATFK